MGTEQWKIRAAQEVDVDGLFPIVAEFATSFVPQRIAFQGTFQRLQGDDHACLLVADNGGRPIGYLLGFEHPTFFANGPVAWVEEVAVVSSWRRKGVGRALMAQFEEWAASRRAKLVALATRRAAEFYRVLGASADRRGDVRATGERRWPPAAERGVVRPLRVQRRN